MSSAIHVALNSTSNQVPLNIVHWARATCHEEDQGHTPELQSSPFFFSPAIHPASHLGQANHFETKMPRKTRKQKHRTRAPCHIDKRQRNKKHRGYKRFDSFMLSSCIRKRAKALCPKDSFKDSCYLISCLCGAGIELKVPPQPRVKCMP